MSFGLAAICSTATAQTTSNAGFSVARFNPTAAGEWSFWVDHPWYTKSRYFASAGLTLDYAHDPLVFGVRTTGSFSERQSVIQHQLLGHVDLAVSFLDRLNISASLPITFYEGGTPSGGVSPSGVAVGDFRLGLMVRVVGQPMKDAFSLSLGGQVWFPSSAGSGHAGESTFRGLVPKLAIGGLTHRVFWSFTGAFLYRPEASIGTLVAGSGNSVGPEIQFGTAVSYMDVKRRFSVGPEAVLATVVSGGHAFRKDFTSLEVLATGHYNIIGQIQVGLAVGAGVLREPGTPDFRTLLRIAYAPMNRPVAPPKPKDRDGDGIPDVDDACPDEKGVASSDPKRNGCPLPSDRDGDGVIDPEDRCPAEAMGARPDKTRPGCPDKDTDSDGVYDSADECRDVPAGAHPDPVRHGCPDKDTDGDGVFDAEDACVDVPRGDLPDPERPGCPAPDRDGDSVPDAVDACPDKVGAPDPDPKKNGCPGLVEVKKGEVVILDQVFFAFGKDTILPQSFPVLQAVANVLAVKPEIKRLKIEGHTDDRGNAAFNLKLSDRRAHAVMVWLIAHEVAADRLEAHGYGQTKPIADNKTEAGRAKNRRVEFHIVEAGRSE